MVDPALRPELVPFPVAQARYPDCVALPEFDGWLEGQAVRVTAALQRTLVCDPGRSGEKRLVPHGLVLVDPESIRWVPAPGKTFNGRDRRKRKAPGGGAKEPEAGPADGAAEGEPEPAPVRPSDVSSDATPPAPNSEEATPDGRRSALELRTRAARNLADELLRTYERLRETEEERDLYRSLWLRAGAFTTSRRLRQRAS